MPASRSLDAACDYSTVNVDAADELECATGYKDRCARAESATSAARERRAHTHAALPVFLLTNRSARV
jgi:hypothetical protein